MKENGIIKTKESPQYQKQEKMERSGIKAVQLLRRCTRYLIRTFHLLGYSVGSHPLYYIVVPIIITLVLCTGVFFIKYEEDPIALFIPFNAPFLDEQAIVEEHFPMNFTDYYDPQRFTQHQGHSRIIITAKDDQSIIRGILWPEIMELDESIRNVSIIDKDGIEKNYEVLCAKWRGMCMENSALNIDKIIEEIENGTTFINYPLMVIPLVVPHVLGGVVVNKTAGRIIDAKAIMLAYTIAADTPEKIKRAHKWEKSLLEFLHNVKYEHIKLSYYTSRSLADELKIKMDSCLPYIPLTSFIMVTSCVALLWMSDCVRSKPLIGVIGIISSGMAAGSSFGFLIYCGATYTRLNVVALFLVLGIGVDDIFVAIAAWQKTAINDPVPKRLAQTYADAAVAVTITSLTNALAFAVGTTTPTLIVQNFCLYCGVTIVFAYFWFITFCGGFLALAGYMEQQGRHSLFLFKIKPAPEDASPLTKKFYDLFCTSSSLKQDPNTGHVEVKPHFVSVIFRDYVGSLLMNTTFRICVAISLILYLTGAIYGLFILKEGLYRHRMSRDDSYLVNFSLQDDQYFRHLPYSIQVVVSGNLTYSDPKTQEDLLALEKAFESLPHAGESLFTQSWLRSFLRRLKRKKEWKKNITDEVSFIKVLREKYLFNPDNTQNLDVEFNKDFTRILASRMIFQASNVKDVYDDVVMMNSYRKVAHDSKFNVTVFHILFSLFDQHSLMKPMAIQSILIAVGLVMIVALFFIPDALGSIALACSILSIATGVIGYMAFWDVNLDHVSAGSIFMCIGFSVDFSAHITYTYLSSKEKTSEGKIKDSMFSLGLPIIQGGLTTILSLITFLLIPGYGYRTFFKTIFLVTLFAAYHSIILIPLFLQTLNYIEKICKRKKAVKPENKSHTNGNLKQREFIDSVVANGIVGQGTYTKTDTDFDAVVSAGQALPMSKRNSSTDTPNGVVSSGDNKEVDNTNLYNKKDNIFNRPENGIINKAFEREEK